MALPAGVASVRVHSEAIVDAAGNPVNGYLYLTVPQEITHAGSGMVVVPQTVKVQVTAGTFDTTVVATDAAGLSLSSWTYQASEKWTGGRSFPLALPSAAPDVEYASLVPTVVSAGTVMVPALVESVNGQSGAVVLTAADVGADPSGAAAAAQAAAVPVMLGGLSMQAYNATPVDKSSIVNAAIAAAAARLASGDFTGPCVLTIPWAGVIYGAFEMATGVALHLGPKTMLAAMPGQSSPVIDWAANDALHTELRGGRIMGNYRNGATARLLNVASSNGDAYTILPPQQPSPQPDYPEIPNTSTPNMWNGQWSNPMNRLTDVVGYDCGGDIGVYIGTNQRNLRSRGLSIFECKGVGYQINSTDSMHSDLDVGVCGDCILVNGVANKIINFKAWYAGRNAGYQTGKGDGIRITNVGGLAGGGECIAIGETNDNARYGWAVTGGSGHQLRGTSCGDVNVLLLGQDGGSGVPSNVDARIVNSPADLAGPVSGITLDGNTTWHNAVVLFDNPGTNWVPMVLKNSANTALHRLLVARTDERSYLDLGAVSGTYNPLPSYSEFLAITVNSAVTIGPPSAEGWRREFTFRITTGASGSITWDAAWVGAPVIAANSTVEVRFRNVATTSATPSWAHVVSV